MRRAPAFALLFAALVPCPRADAQDVPAPDAVTPAPPAPAALPPAPAASPVASAPPLRPGFTADGLPAGIVLKISSGLALRHYYDVPFLGFAANLALGCELARYAFYGTFDFDQSYFLSGATNAASLQTWRITGGFAFERKFARLRVGFSWRMGHTALYRATNGSAIDDFVLGPRALLSYDMATFPRGALYVGVEAGLDILPFAPTAMASGRVLLGVRVF